MSVAALRALRAGNANARLGSVWLRRVVTQSHDKFAERGPGVNRVMKLRQGWRPRALIGSRLAGTANARPGSVWLRRVVTQGHDKFAERGPGVNRAMKLRQGWLPPALIGRRFTAAEHTVRHAGLDPASRVSPVLSQVSTGLGACLEWDFFALWGALLFFARAKKSKQKKARPSIRSRCAGTRWCSRARGRRNTTSCRDCDSAGHPCPAAPLRALRPPLRLEGDPKSPRAPKQATAFDFGPRLKAPDQSSRAGVSGPWMARLGPCDRTSHRPDPEHGGWPGDRRSRRLRWGVFSFASFSLDKQRKGSRPTGRKGPAQKGHPGPISHLRTSP